MSSTSSAASVPPFMATQTRAPQATRPPPFPAVPETHRVANAVATHANEDNGELVGRVQQERIMESASEHAKDTSKAQVYESIQRSTASEPERRRPLAVA